MRTHHVLTAMAAACGAAAAAAPAHAATLSTNKPCYVEQEPMAIAGSGWAPGANYTVKTEQLFAFGNADAAGNWLSTTETAPIVPERTTVPKTFTLTAEQDGVPVATASFDVVNLMVSLSSTRGRPSTKRTWRFSGFAPGQPIYVHVRRGGRTISNARVGTGDARCGRLARRLTLLPGVRRTRFGSYDIYVDNSRRFSRTQRPQYRASVFVYRRYR